MYFGFSVIQLRDMQETTSNKFNIWLIFSNSAQLRSTYFCRIRNSMRSDKAIVQRAQSLQNQPKILFSSAEEISHVLKASELSLLFSRLMETKDQSKNSIKLNIRWKVQRLSFHSSVLLSCECFNLDKKIFWWSLIVFFFFFPSLLNLKIAAFTVHF